MRCLICLPLHDISLVVMSIAGNATLKEHLVHLNCHLDLVAVAYQERAAFVVVERDLPDDLVEVLRVECFAH